MANSPSPLLGKIIANIQELLREKTNKPCNSLAAFRTVCLLGRLCSPFTSGTSLLTACKRRDPSKLHVKGEDSVMIYKVPFSALGNPCQHDGWA